MKITSRFFSLFSAGMENEVKQCGIVCISAGPLRVN